MHWLRRHRRGSPPHPDVLTPAEWRVLEHVRAGLTNAEIAEHLGVSVNTVRTHVSSMLAKTGLENREQLARWEGEPAAASHLALVRGRLGGIAAIHWLRGAAPGRRIGALATSLVGLALLLVMSLAVPGALLDGEGKAPVTASPTPTRETPAATATPARISPTLGEGEELSLDMGGRSSVQPLPLSHAVDAAEAWDIALWVDTRSGKVFRADHAGAPAFPPGNPSLALLPIRSGEAGSPGGATLLADFGHSLVPILNAPFGVRGWLSESVAIGELASQARIDDRVLPRGTYELDLEAATIRLLKVFRNEPYDFSQLIARTPHGDLIVDHRGQDTPGLLVESDIERWSISTSASLPALSPGEDLVSFIEGGSLIVAELPEEERVEVGPIAWHQAQWSRTGELLAFADDGGAIRVASVVADDGLAVEDEGALFTDGSIVGWTEDNHLLVQRGSCDVDDPWRIERIDLHTGEARQVGPLLAWPWSRAVSPDGGLLATQAEDGGLVLLDVASGDVLFSDVLAASRFPALVFAWSPDSRWLFAWFIGGKGVCH